jgi:hypothetical protein
MRAYTIFLTILNASVWSFDLELIRGRKMFLRIWRMNVLPGPVRYTECPISSRPQNSVIWQITWNIKRWRFTYHVFSISSVGVLGRFLPNTSRYSATLSTVKSHGDVATLTCQRRGLRSRGKRWLRRHRYTTTGNMKLAKPGPAVCLVNVATSP